MKNKFSKLWNGHNYESETLMREYISSSVEQTEDIASNFASELKAGDVIAYVGTLGVGKTAFTRGLAEGLGVDGEVSSPTFSLVHEYKSFDEKGFSLYHFDMYRINTIEDVYSTGYFDYLDLNGIIAIEWSENVIGILDDNTIFIELIPIDDDTRKIKIYGGRF